MLAELIFTVELEPEELRVLELAREGCKDSEMARRMGITKGAVLAIHARLSVTINLVDAVREELVEIKPAP
jgi:predicted DNA-binding protein (UPF0251 family)